MLHNIVLTLALLMPQLAFSNVNPNDTQSIEAEKMWARATVGNVRTAAIYGKLTNRLNHDDALISVSSPLAEMAEIHRTQMDDTGYMTMDHMEKILLKKDHFVQLEPGDLHIMLMRVKKKLAPGDELPLRLEFEKAPPVTVRVKVYPVATTWRDINN